MIRILSEGSFILCMIRILSCSYSFNAAISKYRSSDLSLFLFGAFVPLYSHLKIPWCINYSKEIRYTILSSLRLKDVLLVCFGVCNLIILWMSYRLCMFENVTHSNVAIMDNESIILFSIGFAFLLDRNRLLKPPVMLLANRRRPYCNF